MIKKLCRWFGLLATVFLISSCGLKGPLFLPPTSMTTLDAPATTEQVSSNLKE